MTLPYLVMAIVNQEEVPPHIMAKASPDTLGFLNRSKERFQNIHEANVSVFPPELSQDECQSVLANLAKATGVEAAKVVVQPFKALFFGQDECDVCAEKQLMIAFKDLFLSRGDCALCPTEDFVVKRAKVPNAHGCDLELAYDGNEYCTHQPKEMQMQMGRMFGQRGGGSRTSAAGCKVRLA